MPVNVRTKDVDCAKFFGKGYNHIEFKVSCFQCWDVHPSYVVIDMYAHKMDGSDTKYITTVESPMSNFGRIDAVAYKLYYTALLLEKYRLYSRLNKILRLTYTLSDIGPFLYLSQQFVPHKELQHFNRYYLKNKLTLTSIKRFEVRYDNPSLSVYLEDKILSSMYKKYNIPTVETLDLGIKSYLTDIIELRKSSNAHRDK